MKNLILLAGIFLITGCSRTGDRSNVDRKTDENNTVHTNTDSSYLPGVGEIMNGIIQPHHYKLYLAGKQQNWILADYEIKQLKGGFDRVGKYHKNTLSANAIPIISPSITAIEKFINEKNTTLFNRGFIALTKACNTCHQATGYGFNIITVPVENSFGNQQFSPASK